MLSKLIWHFDKKKLQITNCLFCLEKIKQLKKIKPNLTLNNDNEVMKKA